MESLENQLLIAMPNLADPFFNRTVTYICEHNDDGAMGLIINLPINLTVNELLEQIKAGSEQDVDPNKLKQLVLSGGPVATDRGFVLHAPQSGWSSSLPLSEDFMITTSKDILLALGTDRAPEKFMITLGYAGWGPGQLEREIAENSWLTTEADSEIIFNTPIDQRWQKATEKLGIDISHLSSDVGHA